MEKIQAEKQRAHSAGVGQWNQVCRVAPMPYFTKLSWDSLTLRQANFSPLLNFNLGLAS